MLNGRPELTPCSGHSGTMKLLKPTWVNHNGEGGAGGREWPQGATEVGEVAQIFTTFNGLEFERERDCV